MWVLTMLELNCLRLDIDLINVGGRKTNSRLIYTVFIIRSAAFHARPWKGDTEDKV